MNLHIVASGLHVHNNGVAAADISVAADLCILKLKVFLDRGTYKLSSMVQNVTSQPIEQELNPSHTASTAALFWYSKVAHTSQVVWLCTTVLHTLGTMQ